MPYNVYPGPCWSRPDGLVGPGSPFGGGGLDDRFVAEKGSSLFPDMSGGETGIACSGGDYPSGVTVDCFGRGKIKIPGEANGMSFPAGGGGVNLE